MLEVPQADPRRTRAIRLVLFVAVLAYIWLTTGDSGQLKTRQLIALTRLVFRFNRRSLGRLQRRS